MMIADLIVRHLSDAGVKYLFGMPGGGSNLDIIDAAGRAGVPFVLSHTETAAALMAVAQSEVTGRPGACLATLGPGAASMVNGVACAWLDRAPLIVLTDTHPASAAASPHQRLDHQALFRPVTKWTATIEAGSVDRVMRCAIDAAMGHPRGPVHLDCAPDVSSANEVPVPGRTARLDGRVELRRPSDEVRPFDSLALAQGRRAMRVARRPLLIVGLGARGAADAATVRALCDRGIPALVTYKAKGVVPDDHPAFAGVFTNAAIERSIVDQADLLIGAGLDPVELIPRPWTVRAPIVYCGPGPVAASHVPFAAQIVGELNVLDDLLPPRTEWDFDAVRRAVEAQRTQVRVKSDVNATLSPSEIVDIVAASAGRDARVTVDAGAHMFPATMLWPSARPNDLLISNGLSTMGFALPAAIGAALLDRARRVVVLTGDAGLLVCAGELRTAARERLDILVVVFDDERLSLIDVKQRQRGYQEAGVVMGRVDWEAVARGFGVPAFVAHDEPSLSRAVHDAAATSGPVLVAAKTDPSAYDRILKAVRG